MEVIDIMTANGPVYMKRVKVAAWFHKYPSNVWNLPRNY